MSKETRPSWSSPDHLKEFFAFLKELNRESERGAALIVASMIDEQLRQGLLAIFVKHKAASKLLDGFAAPLGTFAARIKAAMCVGLLSEREYSDCEIIRDVRNRFAHNIHVKFSDKEVAALCDRLTYRARPYFTELGLKDRESPRGKFSTAAVAVILRMTNRPTHAEKHRLTHNEWPY
jgi:mannitol operon repressor